jgi:hypothetical protein
MEIEMEKIIVLVMSIVGGMLLYVATSAMFV